VIQVGFSYPQSISRNLTIQKSARNIAEFVRDLWIARSPYASGGYVRGLQQPNSIQLFLGRIVIKNTCKYAYVIERGFRSYNFGLAVLNAGKNVKVGKDGNRYKVIKVDPKGKAAYRKASVGDAVKRSFMKSMPIGMPMPKITSYGGIKPYKQRQSIRRPMKARKPAKDAMKGIFVISEKAIKADPTKWMMPAREGLHLAEKIQKEARQYVVAAFRDVVKKESDRQGLVKREANFGLDLRSILGMIPPEVL
jgi:hypothetical protein